MGAINALLRTPASESRHRRPAILARLRPVARDLTPPASRVGERFYAPGEVSAFLARHGISLAERTIQWRCTLPAGHRLHIATNPAFSGRCWIPERELTRLVNTKAEAAA